MKSNLPSDAEFAPSRVSDNISRCDFDNVNDDNSKNSIKSHAILDVGTFHANVSGKESGSEVDHVNHVYDDSQGHFEPTAVVDVDIVHSIARNTGAEVFDDPFRGDWPFW